MPFTRRRALALGILWAVITVFATAAAFAAPRPSNSGSGGSNSGGSRPGNNDRDPGNRGPGNRQPGNGNNNNNNNNNNSQTVTIQGTLTAVNATAGTVQVTDRNGLSITLRTNTATVISRGGATATLAALVVNDAIQVTYDRTTLVASRILASLPTPVSLAGTITTLNITTGAVGITTDHDTAITLTANAGTRVSLNGRLTTLASLALGDGVNATYRTTDKIALTLAAVTPAVDVVEGAITALNVAGGTLQLTPLVGTARSITLNAQTQYRLNGRTVAASAILVGQLAAVRLNSAGVATLVSAETPPLVDLAGTITAINATAGTMEVTTQSLTTITLKLTATTAITRNGATATAAQLVVGDRLTVRYEYRLVPGTSVALQIAAVSAS